MSHRHEDQSMPALVTEATDALARAEGIVALAIRACTDEELDFEMGLDAAAVFLHQATSAVLMIAERCQEAEGPR